MKSGAANAPRWLRTWRREGGGRKERWESCQIEIRLYKTKRAGKEDEDERKKGGKIKGLGDVPML